MIPKHIIELAIEGGWKNGYDFNCISGTKDIYLENMVEGGSEYIPPEKVILDPLFWQALGKAKGWDKPIWKCKSYNAKAMEPGQSGCDNLFCSYAGWKDDKQLAIQFFDLLMTNGNTSKFWDSITSLNKTI